MLKGEMKSLREMEEKVQSYFEKCENEGAFPDEAGLIYHLGISRKMYDSYMKAELRRYKPFALCLERARLRRESILAREIFASKNRTPTAKLFLARQAGNGGLADPAKTGGRASGGSGKSGGSDGTGGGKPVLEVTMNGSGRDFFD
jgi:uncharacterized membrane protein YgcG